MADRQIAHDAQGREYWYKNGQWEPINEVSPAESLMIGAGESFVNLGRGIKQGINEVGELFGDEASARSNERLDKLQAGDQEIMQGLREENPISTFIGNTLPAIAAAPLGGASIPGQMGAAGSERRRAGCCLCRRGSLNRSGDPRIRSPGTRYRMLQPGL